MIEEVVQFICVKCKQTKDLHTFYSTEEDKQKLNDLNVPSLKNLICDNCSGFNTKLT